MFARFILLTVAAIIVSGCSRLPDAIRRAPEPDIILPDAVGNFSAVRNKNVRWGGILIDVENAETETTLHVLGYPLAGSGRPDRNEQLLGRFLVNTTDFIDPEAYPKGSEVTVAGRLTGQSEGRVGNYPITLPVVTAQLIYFWPATSSRYGYPYYGSYRYGYGGYRAGFGLGYGFGYRPYRRFGFRGYGRGYW